MPVIINDFEMVVEPQRDANTSSQGGGQQQQATTPAAALRPEDIQQIMRHFEQRRERVRAD
jgi:hypothetical protein